MRFLILLIALVAAGWYVVGVRQARDTDRANTIVSTSSPLSAAQARHASALLDAAAFLNPDREVDVLRAEIDRERGDVRAARKVLDRVLASEPDNAVAWFQLGISSAGSPTTFVRALRNFWRLVPLTKPGR